MSNFFKRLITTLVGVPIIITVPFWPMKSHIFLIILFGLLITFIGSYEFFELIYKKGINVRRFFLPVVNSLILIFAYLYANNIFNLQAFNQVWILFISLLIILFSFIYARDIIKKDLSRSFEKMAYTLLGIFYIGVPSFLIPFMLNIAPDPVNPIPVFYNVESHGTMTGSLLTLLCIIIIFSSDIFSYVFGITLGRSSVIKLEASPNKSWGGYIGGYFTNFIWVSVFYILFDYIFNFITFPWWFYFIITALGGFVIPIGDLVESVIKRSANVKDSGTAILGRGGILDSVDSILYFVPIYFFYIQLYFAFN